jgi:hypothetical protein
MCYDAEHGGIPLGCNRYGQFRCNAGVVTTLNRSGTFVRSVDVAVDGSTCCLISSSMDNMLPRVNLPTSFASVQLVDARTR